MKKLFIIMLVFVLTVPYALCEETDIDGGWTSSAELDEIVLE